jgi:hypothetical protein
MNFLAAAVATFLLATSTPAWSQEVLAVEIGSVGVVQKTGPDGPELPPEPGNLVGSSYQKGDDFTHLGSDVDAHFCLSFGFRVRMPNLPPPLTMRTTIEIEHPLWTRPDGLKGTRERFPSVLSSQWGYTGYSLDESWTMVPGTWRFTVYLDDRVLARQSFELTVEPGQVFPAGGCGAPTS